MVFNIVSNRKILFRVVLRVCILGNESSTVSVGVGLSSFVSAAAAAAAVCGFHGRQLDSQPVGKQCLDWEPLNGSSAFC